MSIIDIKKELEALHRAVTPKPKCRFAESRKEASVLAKRYPDDLIISWDT